jgi:hypothetical protein
LAFGISAWPVLAQDQPQASPPAQPQIEAPSQTPAIPESVPKTTPKSQDRVQDQSGPNEANAPPKSEGRFTFKSTGDNYLRLDRETGHVAYCSPHGSGWACEAVPEERAAFEKEIARLQDAVDTLKAEVAGLRAPPPNPVPPQTVPPPPRQDSDKDGLKLPSAEDIAHARAFIAETWHRLVEMIQNMQKDMMRKS